MWHVQPRSSPATIVIFHIVIANVNALNNVWHLLMEILSHHKENHPQLYSFIRPQVQHSTHFVDSPQVGQWDHWFFTWSCGTMRTMWIQTESCSPLPSGGNSRVLWSGCLGSSPCPCRYRPAPPGTSLLSATGLFIYHGSQSSPGFLLYSARGIVNKLYNPLCGTNLGHFSHICTVSYQEHLLRYMIQYSSLSCCPLHLPFTQHSPLERFFSVTRPAWLAVCQEGPCVR